MVPKFVFDIQKALVTYSDEENEKVLNWKTVLDIAKSSLKTVGFEYTTGKYIHDICSWLEFYGKLLVTKVDGLSDECYDDADREDLFVITDLNWVYSKFLGVLLSPRGYLKNPKVSRDGFISYEHLESAFVGFSLPIDKILLVLRHFKMMVQIKGVKRKVMLPGALSNYKDPSFVCSGERFSYVIARECELLGGSLNIATVPEIQVKVGERFGSVVINFFGGGLFFKQDALAVLIEALDLQKSVRVYVGVQKAYQKPEEEMSHRTDAGKMMDILYKEIVCGTINAKNVSSEKVHYALSCLTLLNSESLDDYKSHVLYNLENVKDEMAKKKKIIHHCNSCKVSDEIGSLLTKSEQEEDEGGRWVC